LDEADELPAPLLNESDGTTLIIRNRERPLLPPQAPEEAFSPPPAAAAAAAAAPAAESPPPWLAPETLRSVGPAGIEWSPPSESLELSSLAREAEETVLDGAPGPSSAGVAEESHTEVLAAEDLPPAKQLDWPPKPSVSTAPPLSIAPAESVPAPALEPAPSATPRKAAPAPTAAEEAGPSRMFILLASYASAITLAFLMLLIREFVQNGRPSQLESLPDIQPEKMDSLTFVALTNRMPPGHTLKFGEKRRYGNILVEPLRVTREPVQFVHYSGNAKTRRDPSAPVWKLWVRLTNVSRDQTIAPLDRRLVLRRVVKGEQSRDFSNFYIFDRGASDRNAPSVGLYPLTVTSDWDLVGEDLGKALGPGESYETYLASEEAGLDRLGDDLLWRMQIRKGYSPKGNGVTTMVQVAFRKSDIQMPPAAPAKPS
jgi:hypothetical protein